jgi:hypothetical protein
MYEMCHCLLVQLHVSAGIAPASSFICISTGIAPISGSELLVYSITDTSMCPKLVDTALMWKVLLLSSLFILLVAIF